MKLKLRDDYKDRLESWRLHQQSELRAGRDYGMRGWGHFFEPDNAVTFADLKPGQIFSDGFNLFVLCEDGLARSVTRSIPMNASRFSKVIPGTIIDGKFVPDEPAPDEFIPDGEGE